MPVHQQAEDNEVRRYLTTLAAAAARDPDRDLAEVFAEVGEQQRVPWRIRLQLFERTLEADPVLSPFVATLVSWIRGAEAAEAVSTAIAGEPELHDDTRVLDDIWTVQRVRGQARRAVFSQLKMLSSRGVAEAVGSQPGNREAARSLRERGDVIGLETRQGYAYPAFQFDPERKRVWIVVASVNRMLDARHDPWGVAGWWITRDRQLGSAPWELVADPDRADEIRAAAEAVTEPIG